MPTSAFSMTASWGKAADGPLAVLVPAVKRFSWAITAGPVPTVARDACPWVDQGKQLSLTLAAGESLYVYGDVAFSTSVTTGA